MAMFTADLEFYCCHEKNPRGVSYLQILRMHSFISDDLINRYKQKYIIIIRDILGTKGKTLL